MSGSRVRSRRVLRGASALTGNMHAIAVRALQLRFEKAVRGGDRAALRALLAPRVRFHEGEHTVIGSQGVIDALLSGRGTPPPLDPGALHLRGRRAVIRGRGPSGVAAANTWTRTWLLTHCRTGWRIVSIRDTPPRVGSLLPRTPPQARGTDRLVEPPGLDPSRWVFRLAQAHDATELSTLMRRCFLAANGHCGSPAAIARFLDDTYRADLQATEIADSRITTVLVECDRHQVGYAQLRNVTSAPACVRVRPSVELGRIYLLPTHLGQGLGSMLMRCMLEQARRVGARSIWLNVWQQADRAIAFYRRQGFEITGQSIFMIGEEAKDDWVMTRSLEAAP